MKKTFLSLCFFISIILLTQSCQETPKTETSAKKESQQSLNPNGDSELAVLMRQMFEEAEKVKEQIKKGEEPKIELDHAKILSAHATEPEKVATQEFKDFAKMYLANIEQLKKANKDNVEMVFESLVQSCMSCHAELCPGPMVRIKKLTIAKK